MKTADDQGSEVARNRADDLWIESHLNLGDHPKMKRLARLLSIGFPQTVGHLHYLWWWGVKFALNGDVSRYDAIDIANAALWDGDADQFTQALVDCRFIDIVPTGTLLHDWLDYTKRLLEAKAKNRERQQRFRERQQGSKASNNEARNGYVTVTSPSHNAVTNNQEPITNNQELHNPQTPVINPARETSRGAPAGGEDTKTAESQKRRQTDAVACKSAFQPVWEAYPLRDGAKAGSYSEGLAAFAAIPPLRWPDVLVAARNYAATNRRPRDICNFLSGDFWESFIDTQPVQETNGHANHQPTAERRAATVSDIVQLAESLYPAAADQPRLSGGRQGRAGPEEGERGTEQSRPGLVEGSFRSVG